MLSYCMTNAYNAHGGSKLKAKLKTGRVREILLRRSISQNYLAGRLKISSGYCSQLLSGTRTPSPRLRVKLMKELKEDFDALFEPMTTPEEPHAQH